MLSPRWRKMLRDASQHKSRTALVVVALVVGLIGAGALLASWALVRQVTAQTFIASRPVSATLRVERVDDALLASLRQMPQVAAVRARRVVYAGLDANGRRTRVQLFALSDWQARDIGQLRPERGSWPPQDGEIVLEPSSLEFAGAQFGQSVQVTIDQGASVTLPVSGITRDVSLAPGWMDHIATAFVTPATLARLGAPADFNEIQFVVRDTTLDRDAVRRIADEVRARIEQEGGRVTNIVVPVPGEHVHAAQMDSLSLTQGAFALMTLAVCALLVVNLVAGMLASQTREIGVMKALGASARQIGTLYAGFALALGLASSLVALPLAIAIARPYAAMKLEMLNFPIGGAAVPWWVLLLLLAAGCVLPVAAAAIPVVRACRLRAADALRDSGIVADGGHLRRRFVLPGISRPLQLSIGNAFRKPQRMLLTVLALAAGGAVYLGADSLRSGVRASVTQLFAGSRYDVSLHLSDGAEAARAERAALTVPGVIAAQALVSATGTVLHKDGLDGERFALVGLPPSSPLLAPLIQQGRGVAAGDGQVLVVSRSLLKDEPALVLGADVELRVSDRLSRWRVIGVVDVGPQPLAYVPAAALNAARGSELASILLLTLGTGDVAVQRETILRTRAVLATAGIAVGRSELVSEARRVFEDHLLMVVQFLGVMGWAMIAIGAIGLASTMSLGVLERTREIGVMRALGATDRAIASLVQFEGLVVAGLAWMVSLLLSLPIGQLLADAFGRVMFTVPMQPLPPARAALSWGLLLVLVSAIACSWPARRAVRLPAARVLAYE
ncbi:MAG: FtsX-like permease family protein [Rhodanobacteraceae bacterium]|nr:FtsX-like permease family protein [Rhodanobacteraceae bacterium]